METGKVFKVIFKPDAPTYQIQMVGNSWNGRGIYSTCTIKADNLGQILSVLDLMCRGYDVEGYEDGGEEEWLVLGIDSLDTESLNGVYMVLRDGKPVRFYHQGSWFKPM